MVSSGTVYGVGWLVGCPETSATSYQYAPCNIPEDRSPEIRRGGSLKSCMRKGWSWYENDKIINCYWNP